MDGIGGCFDCLVWFGGVDCFLLARVETLFWKREVVKG